MNLHQAFDALRGIAPPGFGVRRHHGRCQVYVAQIQVLAEGATWDEVVGKILKEKGR